MLSQPAHFVTCPAPATILKPVYNESHSNILSLLSRFSTSGILVNDRPTELVLGLVNGSKNSGHFGIPSWNDY